MLQGWLKPKTHKAFWLMVIVFGLFARSASNSSRAEPTHHTRGVAVVGAALTLGFRV